MDRSSIFGGENMHAASGERGRTHHRRSVDRPSAERPDSLTVSDTLGPSIWKTEDRKNAVGPMAIATPGNLKAWSETLDRFGTLIWLPLCSRLIKHASRAFRVSHYSGPLKSKRGRPFWRKTPEI